MFTFVYIYKHRVLQCGISLKCCYAHRVYRYGTAARHDRFIDLKKKKIFA